MKDEAEKIRKENQVSFVCKKSKQWPLASNFGKFEYSPKWPFSEMCQTRRHLSAWFAPTRQFRRHLPTWFARTRQTCESQVLQVLRKFGKFGEFSECRLDCFIHTKYVIFA